MKTLLMVGITGVLLLVVGVIAFGPSASEAWHLRELTPEQKAEYKAWKTQPLNLPAEALTKIQFSPETETAARQLLAAGPVRVAKEITPQEAAELRVRHADLMTAFETLVNQPDYQLSALMLEWAEDIGSGHRGMEYFRAATRIELAEARQMASDGELAEALEHVHHVARAARHDRYSPIIVWTLGSGLLKNATTEWNRLLEDKRLDRATLRIVLAQIDQTLADCPAWDENLPGMMIDQVGMLRLLAREEKIADASGMTGSELGHRALINREPAGIWDNRIVGPWFYSMIRPIFFSITPELNSIGAERNQSLNDLAALREAAAARLGTLAQAATPAG